MGRCSELILLLVSVVGLAASCQAYGQGGFQLHEQRVGFRLLQARVPPYSCPAAIKQMIDAASEDAATQQRINQDCRSFVKDVSTCGAACMCTFVNEVLNISRTAYDSGLFPPPSDNSDFLTGAACGAFARELFVRKGFLPAHVLEIWNGSECLPVIAEGEKCHFDEEPDSAFDTGTPSVRQPASAELATTAAASRPAAAISGTNTPHSSSTEPAGVLGRKIKL